ncbi:neocarzinostatin apoprotein domain-containing protein [Nonomuraea sp. NPDC048916]|uniref:neocarzinostatin apoprotein domain-containing protein n=1 Tax=Nonomuraea sp. NPDC048916 TaxID=3154232 RepID=UPI0033D00E5E
MPYKPFGWAIALLTALALTSGPAAAGTQPELTVAPAEGVAPGGEVTVTGAGFTPETVLFLALCDTGQPPGKACDTGNFARVTTGADGGLKAKIKLAATFGTTDCAATTCALMTNDPANPRDTRDFAQAPVTFAAPAAATSAPAASPPTSAPAASPAAAAETTDDGGPDTLLVAGIAVAVLVLIGVAVLLVRRRRPA